CKPTDAAFGPGTSDGINRTAPDQDSASGRSGGGPVRTPSMMTPTETFGSSVARCTAAVVFHPSFRPQIRSLTATGATRPNVARGGEPLAHSRGRSELRSGQPEHRHQEGREPDRGDESPLDAERGEPEGEAAWEHEARIEVPGRRGFIHRRSRGGDGHGRADS